MPPNSAVYILPNDAQLLCSYQLSYRPYSNHLGHAEGLITLQLDALNLSFTWLELVKMDSTYNRTVRLICYHCAVDQSLKKLSRFPSPRNGPMARKNWIPSRKSQLGDFAADFKMTAGKLWFSATYNRWGLSKKFEMCEAHWLFPVHIHSSKSAGYMTTFDVISLAASLLPASVNMVDGSLLELFWRELKETWRQIFFF